MKRLLILPAILILAGACNDDAPTNPAPVPAAAFTAGGTRQAGQATTFDASTSADPAGGGLSYSWAFGDGAVGGTSSVAHVYGQAGAYPVQLTVRDAAGKTATATQTVAISAGSAPTGTAELSGRVTLADGTPLAGVTVALVGGTASELTGADGLVTLEGVPAGVPLVVRLTRAGYADGSARLDALPNDASDGWFEAALAPRGPAVVLASAEAGGTVAGPSGAQVVFPAGGLVRADGSPATGAVDVAITPVDVAHAIDAFPGPFAGVEADGETTPIASFGVMEVALSQGGQPLQVAPGRSATLEIPIYTGGATLGQTIPLWSLDEVSGTWVQEGTGTVVAAAGSPTGLALRGTVAHLSWWNIDNPFEPFVIHVLCLTEATPAPVPATDYCFVEASQEGEAAPRVSSRQLLRPGQRTALKILPGVSTRISGVSTQDSTLTVSVLVTPTSEGSQDVDLVLPAAEPPPVRPAELVAVGGNLGLNIVTFDGTRWLPRTSTFDVAFAVASSGTMWVAGGRGTDVALATSSDGAVWSPVVYGTGVNFVRGIAWNGSMWVAVGQSPGVALFASSLDGRTWTPATSIPPNMGMGRFVAWNGSYWLAGTNNALLRSSDGAVWTIVTTAPFNLMGGALAGAWNGSRWVVVGTTASGAGVATSQDGVIWTTQLNVVQQPRGVAWNGSSWLVAGSGATATSSDGSTWATHPTVHSFSNVAWTGTTWIGAGSTQFAPLATSPDGVTWTPVTDPLLMPASSVAARRPLYPALP